VVFFHKPSKTALFCDLIQRYQPWEADGWKGIKRRVDGMVGEHGGTSTPREWIWFFRLGKQDAQTARDTVLQKWKPDRLLIAHGECAQTEATEIIRKALWWAV
jgi:hypothetical protein